MRNIKTKDGKEILSMPLWLGAAGAVLAPVAVAVGAIAGLAAEWILVVERDDETS